jgi:hypothetical protein
VNFRLAILTTRVERIVCAGLYYETTTCAFIQGDLHMANDLVYDSTLRSRVSRWLSDFAARQGWGTSTQAIAVRTSRAAANARWNGQPNVHYEAAAQTARSAFLEQRGNRGGRPVFPDSFGKPHASHRADTATPSGAAVPSGYRALPVPNETSPSSDGAAEERPATVGKIGLGAGGSQAALGELGRPGPRHDHPAL